MADLLKAVYYCPAQSVVWDSTVPSRKRTCVNRPKPSPVEKLTKDLYTILHEQQSSYFSGSSEEDLLFESETPMVSVEIGWKYNVNKSVNAASSVEKAKQAMGQGMQLEQPKRDKFQHEKLQLLGSRGSPLCNIDFNGILNFEEFTKNLSSEEQQHLGNMFDSPQFKENLCSFQQLLEEGVFDISFSDAKTEDHKTLKRLVLFNLMKSKWVEHYHQLKKLKNSTGKLAVGRGPNAIASNSSVIINSSLDSQNHKIPEARGVMKSPKRVIMKASYESKELIDNDGSCFSPRSLFALPSESSSFMLDSLYFVDESPDQDLLLDVPSNSSFPQAELLNPTISFGQQASTSSSSIYPHLVRP
ncbi:zinc finger family protein [Tripterygium wilfordii]|uniref:Zinc finger family protein n=1 Tax=Tripterygium wilfordii TaxID=458696 RepID=A0A7J7CJL5_TRIWF|nr:zinc finger family protein [Tripterygium wilfordii]